MALGFLRLFVPTGGLWRSCEHLDAMRMRQFIGRQWPENVPATSLDSYALALARRYAGNPNATKSLWIIAAKVSGPQERNAKAVNALVRATCQTFCPEDVQQGLRAATQRYTTKSYINTASFVACIACVVIGLVGGIATGGALWALAGLGLAITAVPWLRTSYALERLEELQQLALDIDVLRLPPPPILPVR